MSDKVDRRIVEMRFDNEQFEKNVGQTLITLETLKKALEMSGAEKGLENVATAANNVDMSGVQNGVEQTTKQFSAMEVVAITALANITNSAVNAGKRLVGSFVSPLIQGGKQRAQNMAQAKFMFAGLKYAADEIGGVGQAGTIMDNIYKSVEGTFYSLDKAALVGAQIMAAGIKGTTDEFTTYMRGVAGVASVYSADYQRVGEIFAQTAALGHLSGRELESFRSMSVPVLQVLADYLNKTGDGATYTQEKISDMVTAGDIDFKTFATAMDDAFGAQAQKSKQLFTGAVEDMAAAMARIGEKFWRPLVGSGSLGTNFFNAMVPVIDNINSKLTPAFDAWSKAIKGVNDTIMPLIDAFGAIFDYENTFAELTKLSSESLKDVDGNFLVDPKRVKILEKNKAAIEAIHGVLVKIVNPFKAIDLAMDSSIKDLGRIAQYYGVSVKFLTGIKNIAYGLRSIWEVGHAISEVFKGLITKGPSGELQKLATSMGLTGKEFENLVDIFNGVTSVVNIFKTAISTVVNLLVSVIDRAGSSMEKGGGIFRSVLDLILAVLAALGRFLSSLETPLKSIIGLVGDFGSGLLDIFGGVANALGQFTEGSVAILNDLSISLENFGEKALPVLRQIGTLGKGALDSVFSELAKGLGHLHSLLGIIGKGMLITGLWNVGKAIMHFFKSLYEGGIFKFGNLGIGEVFNETRLALIGLQNVLKVWQNTLKAGALMLLASAVLELAIAVKILSNISPGKLILATGALNELFAMMINATYLLKPANVQGLIQIAFTIRILAGALKTLGEMKAGDLIKGVLAIGVLFEILIRIVEKLGILSTALGMISEKKTADLAPMVLAIIGMAVAIKLLSKPIQQLGAMDLKSLAKGVGAVAVLLGSLVGALILMSKYLDVSKGGGLTQFLGARQQLYSLIFTLIFLAAGINLMVKAVRDLGSLRPEELSQGLWSIALILGQIITFIGVFDVLKIEKPGSLLKVGGMMIMLAAAINMMVAPIQAFAKMKVKALKKGLGSLAILLAECFGFMLLLDAIQMPAGNMLASAASLVVMAVGVKVLAGALTELSNIPDPGPGLSALFGSLLILGAAMYLLQDCIAGAAALIIAAGALMIMAPAIALLSTVNPEGAAMGLLALVGVLAALIGVSAVIILLPELAIGLLAVSAAMAAFGAGAFLLGAGMTMLVAVFSSGVNVLVDGILQLSTLIPQVSVKLAEGFLVLLKTLTDSMDVIIDFFRTLFEGLLASIVEFTPKIMEVGVIFITALLTGIRDNIGDFTTLAIEICINFIDAIAAKQGEAIDSGFNFIISFFDGMANAISERGPELIASMQGVLLALAEVAASQIPIVGGYAQETIKSYRLGLTNTQEVASIKKGAKAVKDILEKDTKADAKSAEKNGASVTSGLNRGLASGIPDLQRTADKIADIVDKAVRKRNEIHSPSRRLMRTGEYLMMGLIAGVDSMTADYQNRADKISSIMIDTLSTSGSLSDISPTITPIFGTADLSQLSASVNLGIDEKTKELQSLGDRLNYLTKSLNSMTETMNSRSLNNYITIDGSADPEGFADDLIRSFRLNARTV